MKAFLTNATGGSSDWQGKTMQEAHRGRGISAEDFGKVAGHVVSTMKDLSVPQELIDEVVPILLSVQKDVVEQE